MKKILSNISLFTAKVDRRQVQMVLILVTLALLVLGAGAPGCDGDVGGW